MRLLFKQGTMLAALAAVLWLVQGIKPLVLAWWGVSVETLGIWPRTLRGIPGIFTAPLVHANATHLMRNMGPLIGLGWLVMWEGFPSFWKATAWIAILSGAAVWTLGSSGDSYIGSSAVAYGYLGYVMMRAWVKRRAAWIIAGALGLVFFSGLIYAWLTWRPEVSLLGHVSGFIAGMVVAAHGHRGRSLFK